MSWQERARCRDADPDLFFPEMEGKSHKAHLAKRMCLQCPVRRECLEAGFKETRYQDRQGNVHAWWNEYGIWGGTLPAERAAAPGEGDSRLDYLMRLVEWQGLELGLVGEGEIHGFAERGS